MSSDDDFASLMRGAAGQQGLRKLRNGESVEGEVIAIGSDTVFLDVGAAADARIDRAELVDETGVLKVRVGDRVRGVVVEADGSEGVRLSVTVGKGGADTEALRTAFEAGIAVEGTVRAANKGGLEVEVAGSRGFCPASQVEIGRTDTLEAYVGQTLRFKIVEWRKGGDLVLSRRQLLDEERRTEGRRVLESIKVGDDLEGTVRSVQRYGAFVDLGGVEGLLHVSELAHHRVDRVEDVLAVGDRVRVRVVGLERTEGETRIGLSMKALEAPVQTPTPDKDEVLEARVVELAARGVVVETAKGSGFVRTRDLDLAPGADPRRAYPVGKVIHVVLLAVDPKTGRRTFSMKDVAKVQERKNFAEYGTRGASTPDTSSEVGTFGALLARKLGIAAIPQANETPKQRQPSGPVASRETEERRQDSSATPPDAGHKDRRDGKRRDPPGVIRRKPR